MTDAATRARLLIAGFLLGVGLGGFFDGLVFHQLLQWHHLLSTLVPPTSPDTLELNMRADGLFHAATWLVTLLGVVVLAGAAGEVAGRGRTLFGGFLVGWGVFNVVEGIVDHHVLQLHHVRPGPEELLYDLAFLAWGAAMFVAGVALLRAAARGPVVDDVAEERGAAPA